jgi:hypothetical protein
LFIICTILSQSLLSFSLGAFAWWIPTSSFSHSPYHLYTVAYRPIAKWWLCKQQLLLGDGSQHEHNNRTMFSVVRAMAVSRQRLGKHVPMATNTHITIELVLEMVFCTRSLQSVYKEDSCSPQFSWEFSSVRKAVKKRVSCMSDHLKVWLFKRRLCVIQRNCYSSNVKILCQEMASEDCNRLRMLVYVCQWSVKCSHNSRVYKSAINWVTNPNLVSLHPCTWQYQGFATLVYCSNFPSFFLLLLHHPPPPPL